MKQIGQYRLVLEKLKRNGDENDILILPRIPMTSSAGTKLPFLLKRLQFPIKPAFALTINRSQSQTFAGKCGIILPRSIWTHGECTGRSCCCHPPDAFTVNNELFNTNISFIILLFSTQVNFMFHLAGAVIRIIFLFGRINPFIKN